MPVIFERNVERARSEDDKAMPHDGAPLKGM